MPGRFNQIVDSAASLMVIAAAAAVIHSVSLAHRPASQDAGHNRPLTAGMVVKSPPGIDFRRQQITALAFIRSDCHFCSESMPFYRKVIRAIGESTDRRSRFVFVSREPVD